MEGRPPFGLDDNAYALLHKVATSDPEPPRQAGPLTGVLMRLLSVDPQKRPSAAEARDMLAAVALGLLDAGADPSGTLPTEDAQAEAQAPHEDQAHDPVRRRRATALLGLLLGLLVLVGGATIATLATGSGVAASPRAAPPTMASITPVPSAPGCVRPRLRRIACRSVTTAIARNRRQSGSEPGTPTRPHHDT